MHGLTYILLIIVFIVLSKADVSVVDSSGTFASIPLPTHGWKDYSTRTNLTVTPMSLSQTSDARDTIGIYLFNHTDEYFEDFVRRIQNNYEPAVILVMSIRLGGRAYALTNGAQNSKDLTTPVIELSQLVFENFTSYVLANPNARFNVSFGTNPYQELFRSPGWIITSGFAICMSFMALLGCIIAIYRYVLERFDSNLNTTPFGNPHIALIFETFGNFFRFLYSLDILGCNMIYPYQFNRVQMSIYIPSSLATACLIILHSAKIIKDSKEGRKSKPFMESKILKILMGIVLSILFIIEFVSMLGTIFSFSSSNMWNNVTIMTYSVISFIVMALFIAMSFTILKIMKMTLIENRDYANESVIERTRSLIRSFVRRALASSVCYIVFTIAIITSALAPMSPTLELFVARGSYPHIIMVFSYSLVSIIHIATYMPRHKKHYVSSSRSTTKTTLSMNSMADSV